MVRDFFEFLKETIPINNPYVFLGLSGVLVAYLLFIILRRRKGERPGSEASEPEL
jgi:hypothetical protein